MAYRRYYVSSVKILILTVAFAGVGVPAAQATTRDFTDSAAFAAATTSPTTIGFNGILRPGVPFQNFNPLTVSGVSFSTSNPGTFVNVTVSNYYSPNVYPATFIVDSVNPSPNNELTISFSQPTFAFALVYGGLGGGLGTFTLSNGHVFTNRSLPTVGQTAFVGFVSTDSISSLTFVTTNDSWVVESLVLAASSSLVLQAGTGTGPSDPSTQSKNVGTSTVTANFPLGVQFFIHLDKTDQTGVASAFALSNPDIAPSLTGPSLFSSHAVIGFALGTEDDTRYFRAVHLGTELLTITPLDASLPAVTVSITVNSPSGLGLTKNQFDPSLITLGHQRGIPPQFLKGQLAQESGFNPNAYRYEVLSVDMNYVSNGQNLRAQQPYALYRLATSDGLSQGSSILPADISPRSIYDIVVGRVTRSITNSDTLVSAENIYDTNNDAQLWSTYSPKRAALVAKNPSLLQFTAQTPLAASYGLLQILYSTAIGPMGWKGVAGARNPSYLFDTNSNIAGGGGSLSVASDYQRRIFARANPSISPSDPSFGSPADFIGAFSNAFNMYNHSSTTGMYGQTVISNSSAFPPVQATPIFP